MILSRRGLFRAGGALALGSLFSKLAAAPQALYVKAGETILGREFIGHWRFICEPGASFVGCLFRALPHEGSSPFQFEPAWPMAAVERPILIMHCSFEDVGPRLGKHLA